MDAARLPACLRRTYVHLIVDKRGVRDGPRWTDRSSKVECVASLFDKMSPVAISLQRQSVKNIGRRMDGWLDRDRQAGSGGGDPITISLSCARRLLLIDTLCPADTYYIEEGTARELFNWSGHPAHTFC